MKSYFILLLVIMLITFIQAFSKDPQKNKKPCVIIVTAILTCYSGFRTWWYGDLIKYYTLYRNCNGSNWKDVVFGEWQNVGIRAFFKIAGTLGISYDVCIFLIAAFIAICVGVLVYKYSSSPYWSYLMFIAMGFYDFTLSGLKQTIAMGFCMIAFVYIIDQNKWKFLLFTGIAFLFHSPAAIFFLAYPIAKKKIDRKYYILIVAAFVTLYAFRNRIVEFASEAYYEDESKFSANGGIGGRTLMMVFIMAFALFMRKLEQDDRLYAQLFNIMVFASMVQVFSMYNNVFSRLADYYYVFILLFFPLIMESGEHQAKLQPERKDKIRFNPMYIYVIASISISIYALYYYHNYMDGDVLTTTFKFFWEIDAHKLYGA